MSLYFPGIEKAIEAVNQMTEDELLNHIDGLYGRDNLPGNYTLDELRHEAIIQTKEDFTDKTSREYELAQFWVGMAKINRP